MSYALYNNSDCTSLIPIFNAADLPVSNGILPDLPAYPFNSAGTYYWQAVYSGDTFNAGSASACSAEPLIVTDTNKTTPGLTTQLSSTTGTVGGPAVNDTAILTQGVGTEVPTGTVTYTVFTNNTCTIGAQDAGSVTLTGSGAVPDSNGIVFNTTGTYYWHAVYSGDTNYNGVTSTCDVASENLTVINAKPTITTTLSATTILVNQAGRMTVQLLVESTSNAVGTVTYSIYSNDPTCLSKSAGCRN